LAIGFWLLAIGYAYWLLPGARCPGPRCVASE
jgi:hypothetical protein